MKLLTQRQAMQVLRAPGLSLAACQKAIDNLPAIMDGKRRKVTDADVTHKAAELTTPKCPVIEITLSERHKALAAQSRR